MAVYDNEKTRAPIDWGLLPTISGPCPYVRRNGCTTIRPALATSIMSDRGGTIVTEDDKQNAHEQAVAMRLIRACGHGEYLQHLRNSFLDGKDIYPKKISDAFAIMDQ